MKRTSRFSGNVSTNEKQLEKAVSTDLISKVAVHLLTESKPKDAIARNMPRGRPVPQAFYRVRQ